MAIEGDTRHLNFPSWDYRLKDPFYYGTEVEKLKDLQKKDKKVLDHVEKGQIDLANKLSEALNQIQDLSSELAKAHSMINKLQAQICQHGSGVETTSSNKQSQVTMSIYQC